VLVYLDLNHWIGLAKARLARAKCPAAYREMYPLLQRLTHGGVVLPLSEVHYAEMRDRIRSFNQRSELALTMAELSQYKTLPPREHLLAVQLRRAVARHFGVPDPEIEELPLVGHGVGFAQQARPLRGHLTVGEQTVSDPAHKLALTLEAIEARVGGGWKYSRRARFTEQEWRSALTALFEESAEFVILRGPQPSEMDSVRALGYQPEQLAQIVVDAAAREQRMRTQLMAKPRRDRRPEDVAACAALALDSGPQLIGNALATLGLSYTVWDNMTKDDMTVVAETVPILDVESALRRGRLKNGDYSIVVNDIYDMAALGVAVSCCNVVATDKSARHMLAEAGISGRYNCELVSAPSDLLTIVRSLDS
jgi:hypothetical protein